MVLSLQALRRAVLCAGTFLCLVVFFLPSALAGDYMLSDVSWCPPKAVEASQTQGAQTTSELLQKLVTKKKRAAFAQASSLSDEDVSLLAQRLEFLQLHGVGPKVAHVLSSLRLGGVRGLAMQEAAVVLKRVQDMQTKTKILRKDPSVAVVEGWIDAAKSAKVFVEE